MRRIWISAVTIALVVVMIGCEPSPTPQYNLTISSRLGGEVTVLAREPRVLMTPEPKAA